MEEVDREYWLNRELWTQVEACLLAYGEDPRTYQFKPPSPQTGSLVPIYGGPYEIRESDPLPWAKLYHRAKESMDAGTLPYVGPQHGRKFRQAEFLRWAQRKGVTLPDWLAAIAPSRPAESESPGTLPSSLPSQYSARLANKRWRKAKKKREAVLVEAESIAREQWKNCDDDHAKMTSWLQDYSPDNKTLPFMDDGLAKYLRERMANVAREIGKPVRGEKKSPG